MRQAPRVVQAHASSYPPPTVSRLTEEFSVILVPEAEPRNRHGNPWRKEAYLFDLDVRVKPEHDGFCKIGGVIW